MVDIFKMPFGILTVIVFGFTAFVNGERDIVKLLNVTCIGNKRIVQNQPSSLETVCSKHFEVRINRTAKQATYKLEVFVGEESMVTKDITVPALVNNDDKHQDITDEIKDLTITINEETSDICNPLGEVEAGIRITDVDDTTELDYSGGYITVLCNFQDVDLMLTRPESAEVPIIKYDAERTAATLFTQSGILNELTANGEKVKSLADDGCYFSVAFLTKMPVDQPSVCSKKVSESLKPDIPDIRTEDFILGRPICLKGAADFLNLKDKMSVMIDTFDNADKPDICGQYNLVLMVDVMRTVYSEKNRCNNYVTVLLDFECIEEPKPHCNIIPNPFRMGEETMFTYSARKRTDTSTGQMSDELFANRDGAWGKEESEHDIDRMIEAQTEESETKTADEEKRREHARGNRQGHGRAMVLLKYVQFLNPVCELADEETKLIVENMEKDEANTDEVTGEAAGEESAFENIHELLRQLKEAENDAQYTTFAADIDSAISNLNSPADTEEISVKLEYYVKSAALDTIKMLFEKKKAGEDASSMRDGTLTSACDALPLFGSLNNFKREYLLSKNKTNGILEEKTRKISEIAMKLMLVYPDYTCFGGIFRQFVDFYKNIASENKMDGMWMTKSEKCGEINNCLKKLQRQCKGQDFDNCQPINLVENKKKICILKKLTTYMATHYKTIGLQDIKETFNENTMCGGRHMMTPRKEPLSLWKMDGNNVMHGIPNLDNTKICWKTMAQCTCPECDDMHNPDGEVPDEFREGDPDKTEHGPSTPSNTDQSELPNLK